MKIKTISLLLMLPFIFCGCYDSVEIENRGLVVSLGIDKAREKNYKISMTFPNTSSFSKQSDGSDQKKSLKTAESDTVFAAMENINEYSAKKVYFGQAKNVVFGYDCLKDDKLFKEAVDCLERGKDINRKMLVMATENAEELLNTDFDGEPMIGMLVSTFYKNHPRTSVTYKQDLENLLIELYSSGNVLIPTIKAVKKDDSKEVNISGLAFIKNHSLAAVLDDVQTRGLLWVKGYCSGGVIASDELGSPVPLYVTVNKCKKKFYDKGESIRCELYVSVAGTVEEYSGKGKLTKQQLSRLELDYEKKIAGEILTTANIFQNVAEADGYNFKEEIRKHYSFYDKYAADYESVFTGMEIVPIVDVKITGSGMLR